MTLSRHLRALALGIAILLPAACTSTAEVTRRAGPVLPPMHWDHVPEAQDWTAATLAAMMKQGRPLLSTVPSDIGTYCPGYATASEAERAAFWAGLLSALAKFESTWNPQASGGGGKWIGLLQIDPRTARGYGCAADSASELKNGELNLSCGVRIIASTVTRDNAIATNDGRWRGIAADWAPMQKRAMRDYIARWTRAQNYCSTT